MLVLNFVNQIVVGGLGATAIAAVGFSNSLTFILAVTLGALGTSVSILVARAYGADRRGDLDHTVTAAVLTALVLGAVVSFVPWFFADHVMGLVGALARGGRRRHRLLPPHGARHPADHAQRDPVGRAPLGRSADAADGRDDDHRRRQRDPRLLARDGPRPVPGARGGRRRLGDPHHGRCQDAHPAVDGLRPQGDRLEPARQPAPVARGHRAALRPRAAARRHRALLDRRHLPLQRRLPAARRRGARGGADRHDPRGHLHRRQHRPDGGDDDPRRALGRAAATSTRRWRGCVA